MLTAEQRRDQMLELIRRSGFAPLPQLAEATGASPATVRRDLNLLEQTGAVRRTHGGVYYTGNSPRLSHFEDRRATGNWEQKRRIAQRAAELIEDGDTILFDGGTTTYEVAQLLVDRPIQVVTNSMPVANLFLASPHTKLLLIGGCVQHDTGVAIGSDATEMLKNIAVRRTILSVAAINEQGYFNSDRLLVETEQAMLRAAEEVIVVADSSKFGRRNVARVAPLGAAKRVVVDHQMAPEWIAKLTAAGVEVLIAPAASDNGSPLAKPVAP